jgi:hypothetical protein
LNVRLGGTVGCGPLGPATKYIYKLYIIYYI